MRKEVRENSETLTEAQRIVLRELIVAGREHGQINEAFKAQGWKPISRQTLFRYRQDPDVRQAIQEATAIALTQGLASRIRLIESITHDFYLVLHRTRGTTPHKDDVTLTDPKVPVKAVDNATLLALMQVSQKLRQEIIALTPTTYTKTDAEGKVTSTVTVEGQEHSKISAMEQMSDMLEAALLAATNQKRLLEPERKEM